MSLFHLISPSLRAPAINLLLQAIVNQFLPNSYCITIVSDKPIDVPSNLTFTYIIPSETLEELKDQLLEVSEQGCSDYIVNMRDQLMFMTTFDMVGKAGMIRRSDRKILFLPAASESFNSKNNSLNLFSMIETSFVANILMILPNNDVQADCEVYDLVTHKFVGPDEDVRQPILLDQWDSCTEKFKENTNLFPHTDMKNLFGKIVKVAAFTYKPYVLLDLDPAKTPTERDGLELRIIEEFCRLL